MIKTIRGYRSYRNIINRPGVRPIGFIEWLLGRWVAKLEVAAATLATRRGDFDSLNSTLMSMWASNQRKGYMKLPEGITPSELSKAIREHRVRVVIDEPAEH